MRYSKAPSTNTSRRENMTIASRTRTPRSTTSTARSCPPPPGNSKTRCGASRFSSGPPPVQNHRRYLSGGHGARQTIQGLVTNDVQSLDSDERRLLRVADELRSGREGHTFTPWNRGILTDASTRAANPRLSLRVQRGDVGICGGGEAVDLRHEPPGFIVDFRSVRLQAFDGRLVQVVPEVDDLIL